MPDFRIGWGINSRLLDDDWSGTGAGAHLTTVKISKYRHMKTTHRFHETHTWTGRRHVWDGDSHARPFFWGEVGGERREEADVDILVTGAAGFIGSHVVDALLATGHRVTGIDNFATGRRKNLNLARVNGFTDTDLHDADITDPAAVAAILRSARPEVVVHLAAQPSVNVSMREPRLDACTNIVGLINVLTAARDSGCRKVIFSTSGGTIYGQVPDDLLPIPENAPQQPESYYGLTKKVGTDYLRIFAREHGLEYVALALGNVYGPRQDPAGEAGVVGIFADRLLAGEPCVVYGDGKTTRDYVYVSDVVDAVLCSLTLGAGLINIGTGVETSVLDVHAALAGHLDVPDAPVHADPRPGEVRRVCLDVARAEAQLGWRPRVDLPAGASALLSWLRTERS
jgi:UDP-glucose 4-epimerase